MQSRETRHKPTNSLSVDTLGYFRHTDNSSGNGRLLTALVYLNVTTPAVVLVRVKLRRTGRKETVVSCVSSIQDGDPCRFTVVLRREESQGAANRLGRDVGQVRTEVEPRWNRLLLFWSDDRSPHEVLSACKDRGLNFDVAFFKLRGFAATVWYYDQPNPSIPLTELGAFPELEVAETIETVEEEPVVETPVAKEAQPS